MPETIKIYTNKSDVFSFRDAEYHLKSQFNIFTEFLVSQKIGSLYRPTQVQDNPHALCISGKAKINRLLFSNESMGAKDRLIKLQNSLAGQLKFSESSPKRHQVDEGKKPLYTVRIQNKARRDRYLKEKPGKKSRSRVRAQHIEKKRN